MTEKSTNIDNKKVFTLNEWSNRARKRKHTGYIYIYYKIHPNSDREGWIGEHRLVMENHLGRYLETFEHIHHINENRSDNRIENLELHTASTHYLEHHKQRRINDIAKRICVRCGTNKPPLSSKVWKGNRYYFQRWHRNPLNKNEWVCESCYKKIRKEMLSKTAI
jgi:HNH endonuclease